jgi:hypothetical protein
MTRGVALLGRGALSRGAVRMSLEEPVPTRGRREEMTPGRTIIFEDEGEEEEGTAEDEFDPPEWESDNPIIKLPYSAPTLMIIGWKSLCYA